MMHNVNSLFPRPVRAVPDPLALWLRPGRMDHRGMLDMMAAGDVACFGAVFDPVLSSIHAELREQVLKHRLDAVLDPKTQPAATAGGYTEALGRLPWGLGRPQTVEDFDGLSGRRLIAALGEFVLAKGFTQGSLMESRSANDSTRPLGDGHRQTVGSARITEFTCQPLT